MSTEKVPQYALSIKQPWAALIVSGLKTIEIRRWPTARRGRILIHAARVPDKRPEAKKLVPKELDSLVKLCGGIVGAADLTDCVHYTDFAHFQSEQSLHFNEPTWFEKKGMYGFVFANAEILPFRSFSGWVRFFRVDV